MDSTIGQRAGKGIAQGVQPTFGKREPLYKGLFHALRRRIELGQLVPGTRAPSEADLIAEFRISSTTARRCLDDLQRAGYVDRVQGKGTFVRPPSALARCRHIGLLYYELFSLADVFLAHVLRGIAAGLQGEGASEPHSEFQPTLLASGAIRRSGDPSAALRELVHRHQVEGLIVLSPVPVACLRGVLDDELPVASINFRYQDERVMSATVDAQAAFDDLLGRLREQGHRKVVSVIRTFAPELLDGVLLNRVSDADRAAAFGIDWRAETFRYFEPDQTRRIAARQLADGTPATAFVGIGYEMALELREAVKERGRQVPEDVSVLFQGVPAGPTELSGEIVPVEQMGRWAADAVLARVRGGVEPEEQVKIFPARFHRGSTLGPARS